MTSPSVLWLERGNSVPGRTSQALAVCLAIAWDGWIELCHGGAWVDVQLQRVDIAGTPYFRVASIGGVAAP